MSILPERVELVIMAACCLHNLLRERMEIQHEADIEDPETHEVIPGTWRQEIHLPRLARSTCRATQVARDQRTFLADYFFSEAGQVPWQLDRI